MRNPLGIYLVVVVFLLTWPLHMGAACFVTAESIGEYFEPHKDHLLFWLGSLPVGGLVTLLLVVNIFIHRRFAFYVSSFVFLGGLLTLSRFHIRDAYDWVFEIALAILLLVSAFYLIWRVRYLRVISNEKREA
jgi:hypothetical protein